MKLSTHHPRMIYQNQTTKDKILASAFELIKTQGLFDLQMKTIAEIVGISRNTLYRYFRNKADLASALMVEILVRMHKDMEPEHQRWLDLPPVKGIQAYFTELWLNDRFVQEYAFLAEFDAYYSGSRQIPLPALEMGVHDQHFERDILFRIILQGQEKREIRRDIDAHLMAVTMLNAIRSLHQRLLLRGESLVETKPEERSAMAYCALSLLLDGCGGNHESI